MKNLILLDVDGTIAHSGNIINEEIAILLNRLRKSELFEIGIVGGGKFEKILYQLDNKITVEHIFSECGSIYYKLNQSNNYELIYRNNIRDYKHYKQINSLIKIFLKYISSVDYLLSGTFVDLREGLIYLSLVGMQANEEERRNFMEEDKKYNYRENILEVLQNEAKNMNINGDVDILLGGSVGIAIYPKEWNKVQVIENGTIDKKEYDKIDYFGDKYDLNGNDYQLLHHPDIIGVKVDTLDDTIRELQNIISIND